jgi:hypothetical protein
MKVDNIDQLSGAARVWIYQSERAFEDQEVIEIQSYIDDFLHQWTAHNQKLLSFGAVHHRRFIAIFVDEAFNTATGCSIDMLTHFIEALGAKLGVDFFERMNFAYLDQDQVTVMPANELRKAYSQRAIDDNTLFFNNLVKTKSEFQSSWLVPLKDSWHKRFL